MTFLESLNRLAGLDFLKKRAAVSSAKNDCNERAVNTKSNGKDAQARVGFYGGLSLLIMNMTGPGLVAIPLIYQQAGWITPTMFFLVFGFLSVLASLCVTETMSAIRGNKHFQANIEYTTLIDIYCGKGIYYLMQAVLYVALQGQNVASIIVSAQTADKFILAVFKKTCGLSFSHGWMCVTGASASASPFNSEWMLFTFGLLLAAALLVPLACLNLSDNIHIQLASLLILTFVFLEWLVTFGQAGLKSNLLPTITSNQSLVIGTIMFNFAYITSIPAWLNCKDPKVNVHTSVYASAFISTVIYIALGVFGAMAYVYHTDTNILSVIEHSPQGGLLSQVTTYLFPVAGLLTTIPVFVIIVRYNLIQSGVWSNVSANLLAGAIPWLLAIPLQTGDVMNQVVNWISLIFTSSANFIMPFILYIIYLRRRQDGYINLQGHHFVRLKDADDPNDYQSNAASLHYHPETDFLISQKNQLLLPETPNIRTYRSNSFSGAATDKADDLVFHTTKSKSLDFGPRTLVSTKPPSPRSFCLLAISSKNVRNSLLTFNPDMSEADDFEKSSDYHLAYPIPEIVITGDSQSGYQASNATQQFAADDEDVAEVYESDFSTRRLMDCTGLPSDSRPNSIDKSDVDLLPKLQDSPRQVQYSLKAPSLMCEDFEGLPPIPAELRSELPEENGPNNMFVRDQDSNFVFIDPPSVQAFSFRQFALPSMQPLWNRLSRSFHRKHTLGKVSKQPFTPTKTKEEERDDYLFADSIKYYSLASDLRWAVTCLVITGGLIAGTIIYILYMLSQGQDVFEGA